MCQRVGSLENSQFDHITPFALACPLISPKKSHFSGAIIPLPQGPVAQLVEQRIENPRVTGSIPVQATIYKA
jgi:hypothetical protein